jgi:hypothetical protein
MSYSKHPLYKVWQNMKNRCTNPNVHNWESYGGKGITVCIEWANDSKAFYDWAISNGYQPGLTLDRIDSDKDYTPDNCHFATKTTQARNRSKFRRSVSQYIGVCPLYWKGNFSSWMSQMSVNYKKIYIGSFKTEIEAAIARDKYITDNNLDGFKLNFPL